MTPRPAFHLSVFYPLRHHASRELVVPLNIKQDSCRQKEPLGLRSGRCGVKLEAAPGFEPGMKVLQTSALPLGYAAPPPVGRELGKGARTQNPKADRSMERETGVEPATPTLARWCSTTELFPRIPCALILQNSPPAIVSDPFSMSRRGGGSKNLP